LLLFTVANASHLATNFLNAQDLEFPCGLQGLRRRTFAQHCQAIATVTNGALHARAPAIWGEGTTACASDSKHFGAWDQNLTTQWHVR